MVKKFWRLGALLGVSIVAFFSALPVRSQQVISNGYQFYPPVPCVTTSAGNPYNPTYPTATCQPTASAYQPVSPTPMASPSPTLGPILPSPTSLAFAYPNSSPQAITVTENQYTGTWYVSFDTQNVVTNSSIVGNQLFFIPAAGNVGGNSTNATIVDSVGNTSPPIPISVGTAAPTAGPVLFTPVPLPSFNPTSTPAIVTVSESNYSGGFTATAAPNGCVGASVVSTTLTVSVLGSNCTATVTVTGGQMGQLTANVGSTPTPLPTPAFFMATPFNAFPQGPNPTPVATTFPQLSTLTVAATIKCNAQPTLGNAIAGFLNAWSLEAGLCSGTSVSNPTNSSGLHFYDPNNGGQQAVPSNGLASSITYFIAGVQNGAGISIYICPQAASPAWTCSSPTTVAYTGTIGTGTNPGYIGIAADGSSRPFDGDIWNFGIYPQLTGTQVQALAYTTTGDPYPSPLPGPLVASPAPIPPLPAPTATQAYSVTDPNYSGALTASPVPAACFSASITGSGPTWTGVITGNGTTGNCSLTLSDSGYNSTSLPVQISPTPVAAPSPTYTNAIPTTPYPVSLPTFASTANMTIIASINCLGVNTTGAGIFATATTMSMGSGLCNSAALDPTDGTGAHGYSVTGKAQSQFTTPNVISGLTVKQGLPLGQYTVGMSIDGSNVNAFLCPLPYVSGGCVENSTTDSGDAWTVGNIQAYIGAASNGTSRIANGLIHVWGVKAYATALPLAQVQTVAASQTSDPYPSPSPSTSSVPAVMYPTNPPWPNFLPGSPIGYSASQITGALCSSNSCVRSYNTGALALYNSQTGKNATCSTCQAGWDAWGSSIASYIPVNAGGDTHGITIGYPSSSDPTYSLTCKSFCGTSPAGIGTRTLTIHIPAGWRTQNSGVGSCDCHMPLVMYSGFTGGLLADVSGSGYLYELDLWNAVDTDETDPGTGNACAPGTHAAICTTFPKTDSHIQVGGMGIYATGSTGWADSSNALSDGRSPGSSFPGGNPGTGFHGRCAQTACGITAADYIQAHSLGYINHPIGIANPCYQNAQSDAWPTSGVVTDLDCSGYSSSTAGWAYTDWITLNRTFAQICSSTGLPPCTTGSDALTVPLSATQVVIANTLVKRGGVTMDVMSEYGPGWYTRLLEGDPKWGPSGTAGTVANLYGLSTAGPVSGTVVLNANLPLSYMSSYAIAVKSCVVQGNC